MAVASHTAKRVKLAKGRAPRWVREELAAWGDLLHTPRDKQGKPRPLTLEDAELLLACRTELPGYDPRLQAIRYYLDMDGKQHSELCRFDLGKAWRAIRFIETHGRHVKGELAGKPLLLQAWQRAWVGNLMGWTRPSGYRRYRQSLCYIPRKNGKTTLAAAIVLYLLVSDDEPGAEVYSAAGAKDQAAKIWEILDAMRDLNPALRERTQSYAGPRSMTYPARGCVYRAIPSDAKLQHGGDTHGLVVDELHVLKNDQLVEVLTSSVASRRQPLILYLTTADFAGDSPCNDEHARAVSVCTNGGNPELEGYDPEYLPVVFEVPKEADWRKVRTWKLANPNLGLSPRLDYLDAKAKEAQRSPRKLNTFLRLHLNVQTDADVAFVPLDLWDACAGPHPWQQLMKELEQEPCYLALDLASRKDLASLGAFFPKHHAALCWSWMPKTRAEHLARDKGDAKWLRWGEAPTYRQRILELCPGRSIDQALVLQRVLWVVKHYDVQLLNFDRWGSHKIRTDLRNAGLEVEEYGQGYRDMSEPTKELEQLWLDGDLVHGGHPILRQAASNVMVTEDPAGNLKPNKQTSTGPIDPFVVTVMGVGGAMASEPVVRKRSVYDERGVLEI